MKTKLIYILFTLLSVSAKATQISGLKVIDCSIQQTNGIIDLNFLLDCNGITISPNEQLEVHPLLIGNNDTLCLPPLIFTGGIREKVNQRQARFSGKAKKDYANYNIEQIEKSGLTRITYNKKVPFSDWMYGSHLVLENIVTGCAGCQRELEPMVLAYIPRKLAVSYIVPRPEQKIRHKNVSLYLNFPQAESTILPDFMSNWEELSKADSLIVELSEDPYIVVDSITIIGYASPEGKYAYNVRLSGNRAKALKEYLERKYTPKGFVMTTIAASEDWDGLKENILKGNYPYHTQILSIIDSIPDPDERDVHIRRLDNGATYAYLLQHIYPLLRRVVCDAAYMVKPFTTEQAKQRMTLHPEQLSLNEMYLIAQSYPIGSPQFNELFAKMLYYYPQNIIARNNLAAVALEEGNIQLAKNCLENIQETADIQNNLGVLLYLEGDIPEAIQCFKKACECGCKEAAYNLKELETYTAIQ